MIRRKSLTAFLLTALLLVLTGQPVAASAIWNGPASQVSAAGGRWPAISELEGKAWVVYDCQTGQTVLEQSGDAALYPASTTKILTAVLVLESMPLDQVITVSATAVKLPSGSSKAGFQAGEQVLVRDALAGMMLASGNDAANALAEAYAGSQEAFAAIMNQKAVQIGLVNSHFCNPSGLHDDAHVATARDMAVLTAYALKNNRFRELVGTIAYSMPATNKHPYPGWGLFINTNRFLQFGTTALQSEWLDHYEGIKTGSTDAAGNNLVAAAVTKSGHELVSVILGVPLNSKTGNPFIYSRTLLETAARRLADAPAASPAASPSPASTASPAATGTAPAVSTNPAATAGTNDATAVRTEPENTAAGPAAWWLAIGGFFRANPWRAAFLALLPVTLLLGLLFGLGRRKRRPRIRPRRVNSR